MVKILYVEDEPDIRSDVIEELTDGGHKVAAAVNGLEGLRLALEFRPDIILSDCLMPGMTGPEMVRTLRANHEEFKSLPVIFLSAHADKAHQEAGLAAGANVYLTKPVDFDQLQEVIQSLMSEAPSNVELSTAMSNSND